MKNSSQILVVLFFLLIMLAVSFIGAAPKNRKGPENGLIQTEHHIWKDSPLKREDVIQAEKDILNK